MKKNIIKGLGIFSICFILVTNLQYSLFNYGLSSNSLSQSIFAQTTTGGGTTGGGTTGGGTTGGGTTGGGSTGGGSTAVSDPVPSECPVVKMKVTGCSLANIKVCYCKVTRKVVSGESSNPTIIYETYTFRGMENTCKTGEETDVCSSFACSSKQTPGDGTNY